MFSLKKTPVSTNPAVISSFLTRGVENVFPSREQVGKFLASGKRIRVYLGIDPTGPTLHLGHAIQLRKLAELQRMGHEVILLIGDFTAMIGDPTDKSATRKQLSRAEVLRNCASYKKQASVFLSFSGSNAAKLKFNSDWLGKMDFAEVLELASLMTVDQMLKRDMFARRSEEGKPIHIHEFMYPLMQGYDSVAMDIDGEIGGNDQTFNMLTGRDLMKTLKNKEKFVLALKLLEDSTGKKMGKTEGNMVSLDQTPAEMFGKVMSWTDGLIVPGFTLCTDVTEAEIGEISSKLASGGNPRAEKARLAREIVASIHGKEAASKAEAAFEATFSKGAVPEDAQTATVAKGTPLHEVMLAQGIVQSKGEWKRLVGEGAVSEVGGEAITDIEAKAEKDADYKIGKRRFLKVKIK